MEDSRVYGHNYDSKAQQSRNNLKRLINLPENNYRKYFRTINVFSKCNKITPRGFCDKEVDDQQQQWTTHRPIHKKVADMST